MAYEINFFGWCSDEGHDKVWGYVTVGDDQLYNFWGKRGKRFAFQKHVITKKPERVFRRLGTDWEAPEFAEFRKKAAEKCKTGRKSGAYTQVPVANIEAIVPGFFNEFEKQLTLAKLFDNFRGQRNEDE
jgi:hypothetical protein